MQIKFDARFFTHRMRKLIHLSRNEIEAWLQLKNILIIDIQFNSSAVAAMRLSTSKYELDYNC